ncbi:hypothetical protein C8R43DRAFT_1011534 [Mycena crocata]|nr:hypothetical protein C8R43DRAFT_1011534 [Mycena crocata]
MVAFSLLPYLVTWLAWTSQLQVSAQTCGVQCGYRDFDGNLWVCFSLGHNLGRLFYPKSTQVITARGHYFRLQPSCWCSCCGADWIISTEFQEQSTGTADIQYTAANVMAYQDGLGLKASTVSRSTCITITLSPEHL